MRDRDDRADPDDSGRLDVFDIIAFFDAFATGGLAIADIAPTGSPDGRLDVLDILAFFDRFAAGCP